MSEKRDNEKPAGSSSLKTGIIVVVVVAFAALLAFLAFNTLMPRPTPIEKILGDLRSFDGKPVTIRGEVTGRMTILEFKSFDVDDGTGSIKVVTDRGIPNMGDTVTVTGVVNEIFTFGSTTYTVILESDQPD